MFSTVIVRRLSIGSIYKLWVLGLGVSMIPLGIIFGTFAMFGFDTVTWNGQPLHGIAGLIGGPLIGVFITFIFTAIFGSSAAFGLWLYSKFRPI